MVLVNMNFLWVLVGYLGVYFWMQKLCKPDFVLHCHVLICGIFFGPLGFVAGFVAWLEVKRPAKDE